MRQGQPTVGRHFPVMKMVEGETLTDESTIRVSHRARGSMKRRKPPTFYRLRMSSESRSTRARTYEAKKLRPGLRFSPIDITNVAIVSPLL
jgi:hypothetical protein